MKSSPKLSRSGFLLLEMVLALAVFSMAVTGFVVALQRMSEAASLAQDGMRITRILDAAMNETLSLPVLEAGEINYMLEEGDLEITAVIEPIEDLENEDGMMLGEIYRIGITARWYEQDTWRSREIETWRYARLYQP